jgi:hypothetical protein
MALLLAVMAAWAAKPTGPIAAIINFYGAPLQPAADFPGLHADNPAAPVPFPVVPGTPTENYVDGTQNVAAYFFDGTHNAGLDTRASTSQPMVRQLYLDLSSYILILDPSTPPFAAGTTAGKITAHLSQNMLDPDASGNLVCCSANGLMTIKPGDPARYGQLVAYWDDPAGRNLQWQLAWTAGAAGTGSCLETSVDGSGSVWTVNTVGYAGITANPSTAPNCTADYDKAKLSSAITGGKGKGLAPTWKLQGYYSVPFAFTIRQK